MPTGSLRLGHAVFVAFIPAKEASHLKAGQPAIVYLSNSEASGRSTGMQRSVTAVRAAVASPAAVRDRYDLDASVGLLVKEPTIVTLIRLEIVDEPIAGSVGEVQVEVGSQRGLELLPGVGHIFSKGIDASE
jgi:hypothetical protein